MLAFVVIALLLTVALALLVTTTALGEGLPAGLRWLTLPGFVWLALMFYLLLALAVLADLRVPLLGAGQAERMVEIVNGLDAGVVAVVGDVARPHPRWPDVSLRHLVGLQQPMVSGLDKVDGTPVCVTNGTESWSPPVRVGTDLDITLLTLRATGA